MALNILENRFRILISDMDFFNLLNKNSIDLWKGNVFYDFYDGNEFHSFKEDAKIHYIKDLKIWFSRVLKNDRFYYAFGIDKPENKDSNYPNIVIDFPIEGIDINCSGAYAQDNKGNVSVILRVNHQQLRKKPFNGSITKLEQIEVLEDGIKHYFFILGKLKEPKILNTIKNFLYEIESLTENDSTININSNDEINENIKNSNNTPNKNQLCDICNKKLEPENFFKSKSLNKGSTVKCKECTRKSYAVKALEQIFNYIEYDTPFKKEDLLNQANNRMQFLDYLWTLQEFNLIEYDEKTDSYLLKPEKEFEKFIEKYGDNSSLEKTSQIITHTKKIERKVVKECGLCNQKLPISSFYKSTNNKDGYSSNCKECSRKSYATKAIDEIMKYVEPGISFKKEDFLNQSENRMQFLNYLWTLQEFNLIDYNDKSDSYILKTEKELKSFLKKYGDTKSENIIDAKPLHTEKDDLKKHVKKCLSCGKTLSLSISNFYKSSSTEDGYLDDCKMCTDKTNTTKIFDEIQKYIEIGKPFNKEDLSKQLDNDTKSNYYIWTLQEQDLIEYNKESDTYILKEKLSKEFVGESNKEIILDNKPTTNNVKNSDIHQEKSKVCQVNLNQKEIIHVSNNEGSQKTIIMKGLIKNEDILITLESIKTLFQSNINKLLINNYKENYSELMIDLHTKNEELEQILNLLQRENWIKINN